MTRLNSLISYIREGERDNRKVNCKQHTISVITDYWAVILA